MKQYIRGYYCRDESDLQFLNKDSNRRILNALLEAYPSGLTAIQIAEKTNMPIKTVYSQLRDLERFIHEIDKVGHPLPRGRPSKGSQRNPTSYIIENKNGPSDRGKLKALPPGNVEYFQGFKETLHRLVEKQERDELCASLTHFLEKIYSRVENRSSSDDEVKKIAPTMNEFFCSHCGVNHEARDFLRAILLYLLDQLEENNTYTEFLNKKNIITSVLYNDLLSNKIAKQQKIEQSKEKLREILEHKGSGDEKSDLVIDWLQTYSYESADKDPFVFDSKLDRLVGMQIKDISKQILSNEQSLLQGIARKNLEHLMRKYRGNMSSTTIKGLESHGWNILSEEDRIGKREGRQNRKERELNWRNYFEK